MFIEFVGKPKNTTIDMVEAAAKFYAEYLMGTRLSKNIGLTIEFKSFPKGCNDYAYCDWEFDNHKSRDFIITVDRTLNRKEILLALAHEMVHLKQYAKGELKDIFRPVRMVKWQGEKYEFDSIDYWETPWEVEAYGREKGMYYKFLDHIKTEEYKKVPHCRYFGEM